jgi:hypothetical protein
MKKKKDKAMLSQGQQQGKPDKTKDKAVLCEVKNTRQTKDQKKDKKKTKKRQKTKDKGHNTKDKTTARTCYPRSCCLAPYPRSCCLAPYMRTTI